MNYEGGQSTEEIEVKQCVDVESVENLFESEEKHFSVKQSNLLFLLFLLSSLLCILADLWHQWKRGISSQYKMSHWLQFSCYHSTLSWRRPAKCTHLNMPWIISIYLLLLSIIVNSHSHRNFHVHIHFCYSCDFCGKHYSVGWLYTLN